MNAEDSAAEPRRRQELNSYQSHLAELRPIGRELVRLCAQMAALEVQLRAVGLLVPDPHFCRHPAIPCDVCLGVEPLDLLRDLGVLPVLDAIGFDYQRLRAYLRR